MNRSFGKLLIDYNEIEIAAAMQQAAQMGIYWEFEQLDSWDQNWIEAARLYVNLNYSKDVGYIFS